MQKNRHGDDNITFENARKKMVEGLKKHGIEDRVLDAMNQVPRHLFVPEHVRKQAYVDYPLSIGIGQTISAPHMVAMMCDLLDLDEGMNILEIGAGCGYHAAVISELIGDGRVYSIERIASLAEQARENLRNAGYTTISVVVGDGTLGLQEHAPYDRINVTCSAPDVPPPLIDQLKEGGKMVIPIGRSFQELFLIEKNDVIKKEKKMNVVFVPLVGMYGF
ncbi:MAG: protein-L-isoaspartate O-methyltransferase [Halobacteriota archaeon]|nr:protein-L-isoaspartate O-methyltransferase [Halobacteriota archaeon]